MIRRIILILILAMVLTSCGGAVATEMPAVTEPPATEAPATEAPAATDSVIGDLSTATAQPTSTPAPTNTPAATLTDTALPTLDLPTEAINAPALAVWDGVPTYPADSKPGYSFRVTYDPDVWALTLDQFGFPALAHRTIANCVLSVTSGRGLPASMNVEHDVLYVDSNTTFDVGTAYENGVKKFVTYTGGDGNIITAFEVSFDDQSDACIADAVTVLSTLRSIPVSQATPTLTP
jgi:hypothetical protein